LAKLGISSPVGDVPEIVTPEMIENIASKIADALTDLPDALYWEREQIIWDMWKKGCKGEEYKHEVFGDVLVYKEYPDNDKKVTELSIKVACSEKLKDVLGDLVHDMLDDSIDEKIALLEYPLRSPARKLADKAIDKAIDEGVDKGISSLRERIEKGDLEMPKVSPKEGEDKPAGENPGHAKMAAKGSGKSKAKK